MFSCRFYLCCEWICATASRSIWIRLKMGEESEHVEALLSIAAGNLISFANNVEQKQQVCTDLAAFHTQRSDKPMQCWEKSDFSKILTHQSTLIYFTGSWNGFRHWGLCWPNELGSWTLSLKSALFDWKAKDHQIIDTLRTVLYVFSLNWWSIVINRLYTKTHGLIFNKATTDMLSILKMWMTQYFVSQHVGCCCGAEKVAQTAPTPVCSQQLLS